MKPTFKITQILCFLMLSISFLSCKKFLDRQPLDRISSTSVFTDKALTEAYLYRLYGFMPVGHSAFVQFGNVGLFSVADFTDEARSKSSWVISVTTVVPGLISATNNPLDRWTTFYRGIRIANDIIVNLKTSPLDNPFKDRILSEARFVRAVLYFYLSRSYGGVPLITEPQAIDDAAGILTPKTAQLEVYNFVDKELAEIGQILPSATTLAKAEYGRATREAAWALNGRVLLYAKNYAKSAEFSKKVMDVTLFKLHSDYNALFQSYSGSSEIIFEVMFNGVETGHDFDRFNVLLPFQGDFGSQMNPTHEMVDAYEMTNGLPITNPASGYNPNDPYKNRDSRLFASIFYQGGATFKGKVLDMVAPAGEQAPLRVGLSSQTGYYIRKFIDEPGLNPFKGKSRTSWKELRLGEVLLNYAEAQNEAVGPDASVYSAINTVRARAQMPALPTGLTKDVMKERIIQERRVELAFEDFRWYDLIRWGLAESVLNNKTFNGMRVTKNSSGALVYTPFPVSGPKQIFQSKNNLLPIPQAEIYKNPNLVQNPGY